MFGVVYTVLDGSAFVSKIGRPSRNERTNERTNRYIKHFFDHRSINRARYCNRRDRLTRTVHDFSDGLWFLFAVEKGPVLNVREYIHGLHKNGEEEDRKELD